MTKVQGFGLVMAIAAGIAGVWGACKSPTAAGGVLLMGSWGSIDGRLTATESSTRFFGACGSGMTNEPIMLDKHGNFSIVGTYGASTGSTGDARFKGAVGSKSLTLQIMRSDSSKALGPIVLHLGQQPTLATCR
jgi:hypothetical protein